MTIKEILEHITILKTTCTDIVPVIIVLFAAAVIMGGISAALFYNKNTLFVLKTHMIAFGVITAVLAAAFLTGAILLLCRSQDITTLTLTIVADDSITLKELAQYFEISDISVSPYGTLMTLKTDYVRPAFEEVLAAVKAVGAII